MIKLLHAHTAEDLLEVRKLFTEYATSLGFDLCFQNFDKELEELPGEYAHPDGRLLVALYETHVAGCITLRKINKSICEMKRLYVRPEFRGKGIGKRLTIAIIEESRKIGYTHMLLDTVPSMKEAIALYRSLGFKAIKPYRHNPIEGAIFMELTLS